MLLLGALALLPLSIALGLLFAPLSPIAARLSGGLLFGWSFPSLRAFIRKQVDELKKLLWTNKRKLAFHGLNLAMIVLSALVLWKSLMVITKSESPIVVIEQR